MYNKFEIDRLVSFIQDRNGAMNKDQLGLEVQSEFNLVKDRSVFAGENFAIRFCRSKSKSFSNTVLALSKLQKYDRKPFIVCLVTPNTNYLLLANSTYLKKISHSSQELRVDNIKGSFNGSDIMREFEGVQNEPSNFEYLFTTHENFTFQENLQRLVTATNNIHPHGHKFVPNIEQLRCIRESVDRAIQFMNSNEYHILNEDLSTRVNKVSNEIAIAAFINNVNLRGRIIEYLITEEGNLQAALIDALHDKKPLPPIFTSDELGDYTRLFEHYLTETDIKTKVLFLSSNPKGYNIDKLLKFLSQENSVYLIYIIAIDAQKSISTQLCSMYNDQLRNNTRIIRHWAGRNSRGVTQYDGVALERIVTHFNNTISIPGSNEYIETLISL